MRRRILLFSSAILVVALAAVAGIATQRAGMVERTGPGPGGRFGPGGPPPLAMIVERFGTQLDLTDEQKAEIQKIADAERTTAQTRHEQNKAVMDQLRDLGTDGVFDEAKVRELANQHAQGMVEQIVAHERAKAQVFAVLTPEQRTKLTETLKTMGPPDGHHGMRRHGHGGGR